MISLRSLQYLLRTFNKSQSFLNSFAINSNPKSLCFHGSKLLLDSLKIEIKMPSLSPTMTEGTIVKWLKNEGDTIEPGDVLCEIQTDKAVVGLETEEEGVLEKIIIPENTQNVQLGEIIAIIAGEGEAIEKPLSAETPKQDDVPDVSKVAKDIQNVPKLKDSTVLIGPSVKKLLHEFNLNHGDVPSTGPKNNLVKGDVLKFIKDNNLKPVAMDKLKPVTKDVKKTVSSKPSKKGAFTDIPVTPTETESASQLIQSKITIPHGYMSTDCRIDDLLNCIENYEKDGINVTLNEFVIKSAATALNRVPKINSVRRNGQLQLVESINISMANFADGKYVTCLIKDVDKLNLKSISEKINELKGEELNLKSCESTFQISNLSALGITDFVEVISPNNVAVLAVSGIKSVIDDGSLVKKLRVTLSFDNYIIGETEAGEFLETLKSCLENPFVLVC